MKKVKNILFIMCDQLRYDYLSCAGHPHIETPHIDWLASQGTRFTNAYVQSPICGSSRMSYYTGRYVSSHGASWNGVPLKVGEMTLGDYLRPLGMQTVLVGKTHMIADVEGMDRLGIDPNSIIGARVSECGFDAYERDDGLSAVGPEGRYDPKLPRYNQYLNEKGYGGDNPWHDYANSTASGSGWAMKNASEPALVKEEDSETPYMTRRAMQFIGEAGDAPWCVHLSLIKPHWPYIAPAPYHNMYNASHVIAANKSEAERVNPHPIFASFMEHKVAQNFSREEVRETVIPAYMGLIKQVDDQMGVLFAFLKARGLFENTMIVFTSDHGDYLGDHWLGEKDLFHEESAKVPLIIYTPDGVKGQVCDALIESIDLVPTFYEAAGGDVATQKHRLEGRSLNGVLHGEALKRDYIFSEYDYAQLPAAVKLQSNVDDARLFMVRDARYKYIEVINHRPILFDLLEDPKELHDLGGSSEHEAVRTRMAGALRVWALRNSQRTTLSEPHLLAKKGKSRRKGILIGVYEEHEYDAEMWSGYKKG